MISDKNNGSISIGPFGYILDNSNTPRHFKNNLSREESSRRYIDEIDLQEGIHLYGYTTEWDYSRRRDFQRSEEYLLTVTKIIGDDVYMRLDRDAGIIGRPTVCQSVEHYIWNRSTSSVMCRSVLYNIHILYFFRIEPLLILSQDIKEY